MSEKQMTVIDVLSYAIQMEIDGKQYYRKAAEAALNKVGKEMFSWLAAQEDKHRIAFQSIYNAIKEKEGWPSLSFTEEKRSGLRTLFADALKAAGKGNAGSTREVDMIDKAKDMELQSRAFYQKQADESKDPPAKKFYMALAAEEQGHYLTLVDYREYLIDPAGYFLKTEHHSLDGG